MDIIFSPERIGVQEFNDLQKECLRHQDSQQDAVLLAPTGSGKTLAYALLHKNKLIGADQSQVLIVVPTRELAQQIEDNYKAFFPGLFCVSVHGGTQSAVEKRKLRENPIVIIGTPGRILYHLENESFTTDALNTLILDEYDKSLELGFKEQIEDIYRFMPKKIRKILVSATELKNVPYFLKIHESLEINFLHLKKLSPKLQITELRTEPEYKAKALIQLFQNHKVDKTLVFCNHREAVERIHLVLEKEGIEHDIFHGKMEQYERELALFKFSNGSTRILITTDLASRGLDVSDIELIVHYQLPLKQDAFTHRNGRTARVNKSGKVILLMSREEKKPDYLRGIEKEEINENDYQPEEVPKASSVTLRLNLGKQDKIRKIDIVGYFLSFKKEIDKDELGQILIREHESFVSVPKEKASALIKLTQSHKIKNKKVKVTTI